MSTEMRPAPELPKENLVLDNKTLRYTMFGLLYFAQGAILPSSRPSFAVVTT
jgi:hypothetical protein